MNRPLIIDSFAGGGGASEGIRAALVRDPDYAMNHSREALAMHRINHPDTHHIEEDVWNVDARSLCAGRPVGLLWMSPDCKHFSKAKGGKPREKAIRGLAWVGVRWIKSLPARQRPRIVFLENAEEFQDWGPLLDDGRPCPVHRGATFRSFVEAFEAMGYVVEWRELRACDYGAPTIRKRLFLIARRDGKPIVWPAPTHGGPTNPGVIAGLLKPWRTAAEIIDWSLPCPSIFETSAEIKAKHGIRANRPLADATMARIAKGTKRYVLDAAKPFLVRTDMTSAFKRNGVNDIDEPLRTQTTSGSHAIVTPFVSYAQQGGRSRDIEAPLHTITASPKDHNTVVAPVIVNVANGKTTGRAPNVWPVEDPIRTVTQAGTHAVVAPFLSPRYQAKPGHEPRVRAVDEPAATIVGGGNVPGHLCTPFLVPRYGERPGQDPRTRSLEEPFPVVVPTGNEGSLAAIHMTRQFGASVGSDVQEPVGTITAGGAGKAGVVAAFLAQHNTDKVGHGADEPVSTIMADGCRQGLVAGFLAQHNLGVVGHAATEPLSTLSQKGSQQQVVAAHMLNLRGSDRRGGPADAPAPTFSAGGNHAAAVYAFIQKYYGAGEPSQAAAEPMHTVTTKPRHGVVTVTIQGQTYAIVDIGMRMLTPRERFNAQGFRPDYEIGTGELEDGTIIPLTLEQQGACCGNSVSPPMAEALITANADAVDFEEIDRRRPAAPMTLFAAE
jgi:DNA (cytosine-5)-methyltransferase 1